MSKDFILPQGRKLTSVERRIFAHEQVGELAPFAPEILALQFDDGYAPATLVRTVENLLSQHPAFTARFSTLPGGDALRHQDGQTVLIYHKAGTTDQALAFARDLRPDIAGRPAYADLWTDGRGGHVLTLVIHPILSDDGCFASVEGALSQLLAGDDPVILSDAGNDELPRAERAQRLAWWAGQMDGHAIARLPHRAEPTDSIDRVQARLDLDADLSRAIRQVGAENALSAALSLLLARYGGQTALRFAIGVNSGDTAARSGHLLPLCLGPDLTTGFGDALLVTRQYLDQAKANALPSELLVQERLTRENADPLPLGAISLHWQPFRPLPQGVTRLSRPLPPSAEELVLTAEDRGDVIRLIADARQGLLQPALVRRMLTHMQRLLQQGLAQPDAAVGRMPLLSQQELDDLSAPYPDDTPADARATHEIIAAHAASVPDKVAIICGDTQITHGDMDARANALAHRLISMGVGAEVPVAIMVERGGDAIIAILAALKAGGAYIPVEPDHPASRNHHILTDAGVRVVLTRHSYRDKLPKGLSAEILCLEDVSDPPRTDAPNVTIHPDQLAYIMYTSGSTGKPKGVAVEHGPLSHHNQTTARVYEMTEDSRELPFLPFSSDGGHERWMVPLMVGGSVVVPDGPLWTPEQTLNAMREHGCNNASIPTTYLQQLAEWAEQTDSAPPMRLYSFGGEGLAQSTFDLLSRSLNAKLLINGYGPTETIMTPMVWKVQAGTKFEGVYAPIGRAVGDRRAYVLDAEMMPCPQGVVGEVYLGGTGVARGYVGKPDVTADRFVPDPFGPELDGTSGARLYRTGDLGRWREDGTIEFVGRVDLQVKINGYRIEPGEIEAALLAEANVSEALVLLREDGGAKRLIAYVTGPDACNPDGGDALLAALAAKLPRHMLPEAVMVLDRMPTNPNAKLDRAALPLPENRVRAAKGEPAKGDAERHILAIWRDLIGAPAMGVTDDFFAMGGRSLTALKALARMRQLWPDRALTIADLFDAPTVRGIAQRISDAGQTGRSAIALRRTGTQPRLYCFPGLLVSTREYLRLTDYLGPDQPVTSFLCHSLNEEKRLNVSVSDVVADYVDHIRRESAGQPCAFLGWSWGGLLAWEAARQLQGQVDLRLIGMVDVCDLGRDFTPGADPEFAPGEREQLERELQDWLGKTKMRPQWDRLIQAMDAECYSQFLRFIGNEAEPLPFDGPEISSREHTFWVLIDNALVFRRHRVQALDVPVASFSAGDSLSRGLNLIDWRRLSVRATPADIVSGTNHLHIIGERAFHERFKARLDGAFADIG